MGTGGSGVGPLPTSCPPRPPTGVPSDRSKCPPPKSGCLQWSAVPPSMGTGPSRPFRKAVIKRVDGCLSTHGLADGPGRMRARARVCVGGCTDAEVALVELLATPPAARPAGLGMFNRDQRHRCITGWKAYRWGQPGSNLPRGGGRLGVARERLYPCSHRLSCPLVPA